MYTLQSVYAEHAFIYDHARSRKADDGSIKDIHEGWVIRFTPYGKIKDPYSDTNTFIWGVKADGLTAHERKRRGRALGKLELGEEAERMSVSGYPDMTEEKLLKWFLTKYGTTRGVEWNIYNEHGQLAQDEDFFVPEAQKKEQEWSRGDLGNDSEFIEKRSENPAVWYCKACEKEIRRGISGHRRSKAHWAKVKALEPQAIAV